MKLDSYWLDSTPAFSGGAGGDVSGKADVVIIGGGFTGLAAAHALARRKASVVVLEAGQVVGEASGRNGGQCNNGLAHDYAGAVASMGARRAQDFYRAHTEAVNAVERLAREEAIDCDFWRCGKIKMASKPEHYAGFQRSYEALQGVDPDVMLVPPEAMRSEIGSDNFFGALVQKTSAQLHVGKFGMGLAAAAVRHGATIYEHAPVTGLQRLSGRRHRVTTPRGSIDAGQVLVATGATTRGPLGWFRRRIVPVGSFLIATEPLDVAQLDRLMPTRRNYNTSRIIGNYFRVTPDNRLLFGGRARFAISSPRSDQKSGVILRKVMSGIFPELADVRIDYCWGGLVDMSADRLPRAGEHDGLFYAMGFSGHGVQMSVGTGQAMAAAIEGRPDANPWRELDWPAIPGHFGKPWFLPVVGAYYRVQDALH
jgi:glycine/D-amino acid oxidase-like deaminating enzyme